ncbi:lytic transglycosylase domain-containing protein [Yersinia ruckeri]|uniref:lytic transglycosylase domain-containing protein n=1 Tax=Yersinia ruckeri TaxID=29486 RepID=UPI002239021D|nr:lytic transglycosylase domain-containing protein [Yersinia ruckeri]MCW6550322.1 lytic transglycosylase domain-containing protein [Yersinia ruckeri]
MTTRRLWSMDIDGDPFILQSDGHQFRVTFDVTVTPADTLSFADIRLYNLAKTTAITQGTAIIFRAGFTNAVDSIFSGYVTNVFREREGASVVTRLLCKSGDAREDRGSAQGSYGPNVMLVDILKDLAWSWPRQLDIDESQFEDVPPFTSGYVSDGDIPTILNKLAYAFDFEWLQDRGRLVVTRKNKQRTGVMTEVSQFTGMVGIPEVTRGPDGIGVFIVNTLNPYFRINGRINVKSEFSTFNTGNMFVSQMSGDAQASGEYNIFALRHRGDSWGNQWVSEIDGIRAGTSDRTVSTGALVWGAKVDQSFRVKVREIADRLGFDPNWLMAIMAFETGRTFSPSQPNNAGGSAIGLIQFIPSTAKGLGTSSVKLARMTAVEQLDYVEKYFQPYKSRVHNLGDCYMAVLWPAGIGQSDSWVMWTIGQREYNANRGLDINHNGSITRSEAVTRVNNEMIRGQQFAK